MKLKKSNTNFSEYILFLIFSTMAFGYLGIFTRFRYMPAIATIGAILVLVITRKYPIRKISLSWLLMLTYLIISYLVNNIDTGYQYIIIFTVGLLALMLRKDYEFYLKLINLFASISFIFAIATIINSLYPNVIIDVFGFILTDSQQVSIIAAMSEGGYPGLGGEVSFNAFCLIIGFCIITTKVFLDKKKKVLNINRLLVIYYAVILTNKRSLMIILPSIAMFVFIIISCKGKSNKKKVLLFIMTLVMPILLRFYLIDIAMQLLNKGGDTIELSNREWFWEIAREMIRSKPTFGHGINTYDFFYNLYKTKTDYMVFAGAHNSYLQFFAELGYVGGGFYIFCILLLAYQVFVTFIRTIQNGSYKEQMLATASIMIQFVCIAYALSENPFYQPQQIFVYFLFAGIAMNIRKKEQKRKGVIYENTDS